MYTVAIIDDHPIVINGLKNLLENMPMISVDGCFTSGNSFLSYLQNHKIDIALLDITLPDGSGINFCKEIKKKFPTIKVLAVSNLSERSIIMQMLQNGASGYLLKTAEAKDILACIKKVIEGEIAFSSEIKEIMSRPEVGVPAAIPDLTKREKQVLQLLADGKRSAAIAEELFISPLTVKTHRATLLQKFQVNNSTLLIKKAGEYGIL